MNELEEKLVNIDNLRMKIENFKPINENTNKNLKIYFNTTIIFNSIQGKGNTFTLQDIKDLLFNGKTITGKTEREINEIKDFEKALEYIEELKEKKLTELNEANILNIHTILFKNTSTELAGK